MSVSDLEQYLLRDDIEAGAELLRQKAYRQSIDRIARRLLNNSFPQYLEDAIQEAEIHTLEKAHRHEFLAALFCKVLRQQGGEVTREPNSPHQIHSIPPAILERARQLSLEQGIEIACGAFCFCQEFNDASQPVTLLTCNHPLRKAVIELALGEDGVCTATLKEFYTWHRSVARNRILDCLRRYQSQALPSLDRVNQQGNRLIDSIPAEDPNREVEGDLDREPLRQQAIRCLHQIDRSFPNQRYFELYEKIYVEGKTQQEIAKLWDLPEYTISRRHTELRRRILQCLNHSGLQLPEVNQTQRRRRSQTDYDS